MSIKATAGHMAADIRRATARLDRAVILHRDDAAHWWPHIEQACSGVVWAKDRAWRWERRTGGRWYSITQAMRDANASITRAAPFLVESLG